MKAANIYLTNTNLAYEPQQSHTPDITVTSRSQALKKQAEIRRSRAFNAAAAASVIAADTVVLAVLLGIGRLIALQAGFAQAGCFIAAMCFFTLTFLESTAVLKHSSLLEAMAHIWRFATALTAAALVIISAISYKDAGGSIILAIFLSAAAYKGLKTKER